MSKASVFALSLGLLAGWLVSSAPVFGEAGGSVPAPGAVPSLLADVDDPAFERYVDLHLLGDAWDRLDAALMTDVLLQFVEGERILQRPHRAVSADRLFDVTLKVAVENKDKSSLDRLTKAADHLGKKEWSGRAAAALKLLGESRAADPALTVPVDAFSPQDFVIFQDYLLAIKSARIRGAREVLDSLEKELSLWPSCPEKQREYLKRLITESRSVLPAKDNPAAAVDKLLASSRGLPKPKVSVSKPKVPKPSTPKVNLPKPYQVFPPPSGSGQGMGGRQGRQGTQQYDEEDDEEDKADEPQEVTGAFLKSKKKASATNVIKTPFGKKLKFPSRAVLPPELLDPAFESYVDLGELAEAWQTLDSARLTDLLLQFTEGERILQRPHRAIATDNLFDVTLKVAVEKKDKSSLERLSKAAEQLGKKEWSSRTAVALKLLGESRAADPALIVSVEDMSSQAFAIYRFYLDAIRHAQLAGDRERLEALEKGLPDLQELLGDKRCAYLKKLIAEAKSAEPAKPGANVQILNKLAEESRGGFAKVRPPSKIIPPPRIPQPPAKPQKLGTTVPAKPFPNNNIARPPLPRPPLTRPPLPRPPVVSSPQPNRPIIVIQIPIPMPAQSGPAANPNIIPSGPGTPPPFIPQGEVIPDEEDGDGQMPAEPAPADEEGEGEFNPNIGGDAMERGVAFGNMLPPEWQDPPFDRHADVRLLQQAWREMDPALLTDAGLQLAEAERILHRPHKAISADKVFDLALKMAVEKKDKATIERLHATAQHVGNKDLAGRAAAALKLVGESRAADPASQVVVDETTPEAFATFQEYLRAIRYVQLTGNREHLDLLDKGLANAKPVLSDKQIGYLKKRIAAAKAEAPEKPDPKAESLHNLSLLSFAFSTRHDAAFDPYVNWLLLGQAWADLDPALLADAALQLAEGERVLQRPNKDLPADKLMSLAVQLAAEKKDKATLERLAKAAERLDNKALAAQINTARKLAGESRAVDPALSLSVEDDSPSVFALYRGYVQDIQAARLLGNRQELENIEKELPKLQTFPKEKIDHLKKLIDSAKTALPKDLAAKPDRTADALNRLAHASRGGLGISTPAPLKQWDQHRLGWGRPKESYSTLPMDTTVTTKPPTPEGPALGTTAPGVSTTNTLYSRRQQQLQDYQSYKQQGGQFKPSSASQYYRPQRPR